MKKNIKNSTLFILIIMAVLVCAIASKAQNDATLSIAEATALFSGTNSGVKNLIPAVTPAEQSLLQELYDSTIGTTNGVVVFGAARKLTGNVNRGFVDYIYSFNNNAGLVLGVDTTWGTGRDTTANIVKGGINLKANIYPFKNFGATNFFVTPFVSVLIATPLNGTSNDGGIGQLTVTGIDYEHAFTKNLSGDIGLFYENAVGEGSGLDGNWAGLLGGIHYKF